MEIFILSDLVWIAGAGALGAFLRFQISLCCIRCLSFPLGTLLVNILGAFLIGVFFGAIKADLVPLIPWTDIVAKGFLGALTTFSTFSMDTFRAFHEGQTGKGLLNIFLNLILGVSCTALGFSIMTA